MEEMYDKIFEGLNSAQTEAVKAIDGPSLILAGAGSGKTRVLTCRVANLIAHGVNPQQILSLTFTKKAAGEMKDRISGLVGEYSARRIYMGTFHSIFCRFLRTYSDRLGYPKEFTIYDQSDSRSVIKQCIKELELDEKNYKPNAIQSRISLAKNNLKTVAGYRADASLMESDFAARRGRTIDVYELYQKKCKAAGVMDFDDILVNMNILLRDCPDVCEAIATQFKYILVDEYQDTNQAQYIILRRLADKGRNICVVGDDSQSIYSFRGAIIENILRFQKDYPEAKVFKLEQNYRSTQTIVNAANSLIRKNEGRLPKECFSKASYGEKIGVLKAYTDQEEGFLIASSIIEKIYLTKATYDSFAILYRTNAQSRAIEEALRRKNLPYRIYSGHSFYDRAEVKDMLAYFRLVVNPKDDESFRRIINNPARNIGDTTIQRLSAVAGEAGCSLFDAILLPAEKLVGAGVRQSTVDRLRDFAKIIWEIHENASTTDAYALASAIGERSGYLLMLKNDSSLEGLSRFENVEALYNSIKDAMDENEEMQKIESEYNTEEAGGSDTEHALFTMSEYLENISLMTEVEREDSETDEEDANNKIVLMTVHASKGLEFPFVYIAGMEENLFPSETSNGSLREIEEERRLFYVALTRAQRAVTVSFSKNRMRWGKTESNPISRFIKEIDKQYIDFDFDDDDDLYTTTSHSKTDFLTYRNNGGYYSRTDSNIRNNSYTNQPRSFTQPSKPLPPRTSGEAFTPSPVSELRVGQTVEHDRFGYGRIMSFDGEGANIKAVVDFQNGGSKTLLLKFAKLRIVKEQ